MLLARRGRGPEATRPVVRIDLSRPPAAEQAALWGARRWGPRALALDPASARRPRHHLHAGRPVRSDRLPRTAAGGKPPILAGRRQRALTLARRVWRACRHTGRPRLDELARRVEGPPAGRRSSCPNRRGRPAHPRRPGSANAATPVYEDWGLAGRASAASASTRLFRRACSGIRHRPWRPGFLARRSTSDTLSHSDLSSGISKMESRDRKKNLRRVFDAAEDCGRDPLLFHEARHCRQSARGSRTARQLRQCGSHAYLASTGM